MGDLSKETDDEHHNWQVDDEELKRAESNPSEPLSPEHRAYLLERHGTVDLLPLPSADPADPLNWSQTKVSYPSPQDCVLFHWPTIS